MFGVLKLTEIVDVFWAEIADALGEMYLQFHDAFESPNTAKFFKKTKDFLSERQLLCWHQKYVHLRVIHL